MWQDADEVVCSRSLREVSTARTRLVRDVSIGGPTLAAQAFRGGGILLDVRRFDCGAVYLRYHTRR